MKDQIYVMLFALSLLSVGVLAQVYSLWRFIKYLANTNGHVRGKEQVQKH
jgi:hypothetical protein